MFAITPSPSLFLNSFIAYLALNSSIFDGIRVYIFLAIAFAKGCSLAFSVKKAKYMSRSLSSIQFSYLKCSFTLIRSLTCGYPLVSVPVLSNTIVVIDAIFSKMSPPFIRIP